MPRVTSAAADLEMVRDVLRGDREAFEEFGRRMQCVELILSGQNQRLGRALDPAEIQDLAQETILRVWNKLATFEGTATLETWVYRFCAFELMNALRKKKRRNLELVSVDEHPDLESPAARHIGDFERIHRALSRLSQPQAAVIRARHFDGQEFDEIAARLGLVLNTVRAHYQRGIKELQYLLAHQREELQ